MTIKEFETKARELRELQALIDEAQAEAETIKAAIKAAMDVPEGEYIVFEHGAFDFETENQAVEAEIEKAMKEFDYAKSGYELDITQGRVFYFYHDCKRFWKYVRPVKKMN